MRHRRNLRQLEANIGRCIQTLTRATPIVDMELRERQFGQLKKSWPADTINPIVDTFPVTGIFLVCMEYLFNDSRSFRPTRWIIGNTGCHELLERWLASRVGMIPANPDRQFGVFRIINLHRWTRRITGAAANTFLLVHLKRSLAIDHRGTNGRHRASRDHRWSLAHVGHEIMIDFRRFCMLNIDGDIALPTTVDLATEVVI